MPYVQLSRVRMHYYEHGAGPVQEGRAHDEPLLHAVGEGFDELVRPVLD